MNRVSTVYLVRPIAPSDKTWVSGFITDHTALGVTLNTREDWRGESTFYPTHMIEKIEHNSGWR